MMAEPQKRRQTQCWSRLLLAAYACFFGVVAPFICWGTSAEPDHPHVGAHLIFVEPTVNRHEHRPFIVNGVDLGALLLHSHGATEANRTADESTPPGQARVKLILAELLILLSAGIGYTFVLRTPPVRRWRFYLFGQSCDLPVPTPPPRFMVAIA